MVPQYPALAPAGARVILAGRTRTTLDAVAAGIRSRGGLADAVVVDARRRQIEASFGLPIRDLLDLVAEEQRFWRERHKV